MPSTGQDSPGLSRAGVLLLGKGIFNRIFFSLLICSGSRGLKDQVWGELADDGLSCSQKSFSILRALKQRGERMEGVE